MAVWFFRSARAVGKSGIVWAIIGVLVFLAPSIPWWAFVRVVIFPALISSDIFDGNGAIFGLLLGLTGIGLGLVLVFIVHWKNLKNTTSQGKSIDGGE